MGNRVETTCRPNPSIFKTAQAQNLCKLHIAVSAEELSDSIVTLGDFIHTIKLRTISGIQNF